VAAVPSGLSLTPRNELKKSRTDYNDLNVEGDVDKMATEGG
jgi:hypothetical protein